MMFIILIILFHLSMTFVVTEFISGCYQFASTSALIIAIPQGKKRHHVSRAITTKHDAAYWPRLAGYASVMSVIIF